MLIQPDLPISSSRNSGRIEPQPNSLESQRAVFVIFTSASRTLKALQEADELAGLISGKVVVVAAQEVPFPLPLDEPPVSMEFILRRFAETASRFPVPASIAAYVCRDRLRALKQILTRNTPAFIGVRKRWWPTGDERLARKLRRDGYAVLSVETE